MRIALFILGAIAVVYLMVKGFQQVLEESRAHRDADDNAQQPPRQLSHKHDDNEPDDDFKG